MKLIIQTAKTRLRLMDGRKVILETSCDNYSMTLDVNALLEQVMEQVVKQQFSGNVVPLFPDLGDTK